MNWRSRSFHGLFVASGAIAVGLLVACGADDSGPPDRVASARQALTSSQQRVLGFESPASDWSTSAGTLGASPTASEGTTALSVTPAGWTILKSVPLSSLGNVAADVRYDIRLPEPVGWGETRIILQAPSVGIHWLEIGSQSLSGLAAGTFHTVTFALPSATRAALQGTYTDLEVRIVVNAPTLNAPYLLDHLVLTDDSTGSSGSGGTVGSGGAPATGGSPSLGGAPGGGATSVRTLSVVLPREKAPADVVIAGDSVVLHDRSQALRPDSQGFAPVFASGSSGINLGMDGVTGSLWSAGDVVLRGTNIANFFNVRGEVTTTGTVTLENNAKVTGQRREHTAIPTHTIAWEVPFPSTPGPQRLIGPNDQGARIEPGTYGDVQIYSGSRVRLAAGAYYFNSFKLEPNSTLVLENGTSPVYAYVDTELRYHGTIEEQAIDRRRGSFLLGFFGTNAVTLETPFLGTLYAPNATIELATVNSAAGHQGAFFGKRVVQVRPDVVVTHRPFPSYLIEDVDVSTTTPCANEPIQVRVAVSAMTSYRPQELLPLVSVDGNAAVLEDGTATWQVQTLGTGPRKINVTVRQGGLAESRTIDLDVRACPQKFPRVVVQGTKTPYEVEFLVTNPEELTGTNRIFQWDFGDGQSAQGGVPYRRHSYLGSLDRSTPELSFTATLRVVRDGVADVIVKKSVVLPNLYAYGAARGFLQPPVVTDGRLIKNGSILEGSMSVRNLEPTTLPLTRRVVRKHFCDPDREPVDGPEEVINVQIAAGDTRLEAVRLDRHDVREDVCGVSTYLAGTSQDGLPVVISAHFDTPSRPLLVQPVSDAATRAWLNGVAAGGLVADPNRMSLDELERLRSEGLLSGLPDLPTATGGVLQAADDLMGLPCEPDAVSPVASLSCQATEDWEVTPPLVRNALKGDLILVASCETIGGLLRKVSPRQYYSHEGIFTRNYYELAESTTSEGRIFGSVGGITDGIDGAKLKYGWPGTLRQTVATAFNEKRLDDPDGALQTLRTFHPEARRCANDDLASPLLVIRPPVETAQVRRDLQAAADFAMGAESHYRFFGYSQANIAFDADRNFDGANYRAPDGEPATVSTTFLWYSLRSAGITLEGSSFEPLLRGYFHLVDPGTGLPVQDETVLGAMAVPAGTRGETDGLYLYTEDERRAGSQFIYDQTYDSVAQVQDQAIYDMLGWSADVTGPMLLALTEGDATAKTNQRERIAAQVTNCFGYDMCEAPGEVACPCTSEPGPDGEMIYVCPQNMTAREQVACDPTYVLTYPGEGVANSPDNFLFWDTPHYGYWDYANYRSGEFRRIHRWTRTDGAGDCGGVVILEDGTPVDGARVILQDGSASTAADGSFHFATALPGQYEVRAEKEVAGTLLWQTALVDIPTGGSCIPPTLVLNVDGPFEDAQPVTVVERRVTIRGNLHITDDEVGGDEHRDLPVDTECIVSPANRDVVLDTFDLTGDANPCADDEVLARAEVTCTLDPADPTNEHVIVTASVAIIEGTDCSGGGNIWDDPEGGSAHWGPTVIEAGGSRAAAPSTSLEGGDDGNLTVTITNNAGDTIVLNPIKEEQRRQVVFDGTIQILDDDWGSPNETGTYDFQDVCWVDPLDGTDVIHWSACVDNEVRVEVEIECSLSSSDSKSVTVTTNVKLFEETTCLNGDLDGEATRFTAPLPACEDGCETVWLNSPNAGTDLVVNNDDEGGDKATLQITMQNLQQSVVQP